jgi:LysM repeat protein
MRDHMKLSAWLVGSIGLLIVVAAGCFQPAGGSLEATSVAQVPPTFTPLIIETPTPTPTPTEEVVLEAEPKLEEPEPIDGAVDDLAVATPDPFALLEGTQVADLPLFQEDPLIATATALALFQQLLEGQQPPSDPFVEEAPQQVDIPADPLAQTATALVANATATAAAPLTQTAQAILGPTPTPTPDPFLPTPPPTAAPPGQDCIHTVVAGENLFRISLRYNTTVNELAAANGIANPNLILVGQQIRIPNCGGTGQQPQLPGGTGGCAGPVYSVMQNDNLFRLSLRFNTTVHAIAACNNIANINLIFIGQQLRMPS